MQNFKINLIRKTQFFKNNFTELSAYIQRKNLVNLKIDLVNYM